MKKGKIKKPTRSEEKEFKHHTRRLSIKEGMFWSIRASFGDYYLAPFSIAMGAANSIVAILNSLWNLSSISQLIGAKPIGKIKRKSILTGTMLTEALSWFLITLIAILYLKDIWTPILPILLLIPFALFVTAGGFGHPSWFSWMGDITDDKFRGRWFSKRSTIISFTTIILSIISALLLNYFKNSGQEKLGFVVLFGIAFIARIYCVKLIRKHYEPTLKIKKGNKYSLKEFIKENKNSNFGKFTIFRGMLAFAMGLTGPLLSIYMLRNLGFDYVTFIAITLSGTLFSALALNMWGKISDKHGNYRVIAITTMIIPITPIIWTLSTSPIYLFLVPAILGGTAWAGFTMASGNFIYDNIEREKRGKAISYFNLFIGLGAFIGGLISAYLIKIINFTWIEPIIFMLLLGGLLRMLIVGFWVPKLREVTHKKKFKNMKELGNIVVKEIKPTLIEDAHELASIGSYLKEK